MQGWCGKLSYERKLKLRAQTQLLATMKRWRVHIS